MKKLFSAVLAMTMAVTMLAGCTRQVVVVVSPDTQPSAPVESIAPAEGAVKTGLSIVTGLSKSKDAAADANGLAQTDIALVAVTVDDKGVIDSCVIDAIQAKINFDASGKIVTDLATEFASKNELGDAYGMRVASSISKEWNEQAAAMAQYAVGKTVEDLKGIAVNENGAPTDADLASSVTLYIGSFVSGIEAAVNNATHLGAQAGDKLVLTTTTNMSSSKDATADANGQAQAYATIGAITLNGDTVTSCYIDAVQANVNFDATGKITTDLTAPVASKNELGEAYGMKKASKIGKEWNEQAAAFSQYVTGKTLSEITGIAISENKAVDADLTASVTMKINGFITLFEKAAASGGVKTGLSIVTGLGKSKDASAEGDGLAQTDIALVAVTVGDDGVITDCVIDAIQAKINFSADGKIVTDLATEFASKNELGDAYGMKVASSIGKEWNEQAAAMAQYAIGKTVEELKGIAVNEKGAPTDADLASSVTLYIGSFVSGIEAAVNNATHLGAQAGDKLVLTTTTNMSSSKDAAADADGQAQAYATIGAITLNGDTVTSCYIDAVQANVNFDATGKITTDLTAPVASKNELGEAYGMKKASKIGKEWNEQAASFAEYVTGKTVSDVLGIAVVDKKPADADLTASVTMKINGFITLFEKAAQ